MQFYKIGMYENLYNNANHDWCEQKPGGTDPT